MMISIIVPIYNVAPYLEKCLTSIVEQTYKDIEIVCVNDGSTDESVGIVEQFVNRYSRIQLINQNNSGLAAARSTGLAVASGEYVLFVDSDDYINQDTCQVLSDIIERINVDVLGFTYKTFPNGIKSCYSMQTNQALTPLQLLSSTREPQSSNDMCFVWRYMIRRDLLVNNKIDFNKDVRIGEDMIFIMEVFSKARTIYLTEHALYNYRTDNQHSLMHEKAYNPYMEKSFSIMYDVKKRLIKENAWDEITPFSFDLAEYTIKQYFQMFLRNRLAKGDSHEEAIRGVLRLSMIQDACQVIGFRNVYSNWKEYVLYLCMKFQIVSVLKRYY